MRVLVPGGDAKIGKALDQIVAGEDPKTVMEALQKDIQTVIDSQITPKAPQELTLRYAAGSPPLAGHVPAVPSRATSRATSQ